MPRNEVKGLLYPAAKIRWIENPARLLGGCDFIVSRYLHQNAQNPTMFAFIMKVSQIDLRPDYVSRAALVCRDEFRPGIEASQPD